MDAKRLSTGNVKWIVILIFCLFLVFAPGGEIRAEDKALEELLEIMEEKGVISSKDAEKVRDTITHEGASSEKTGQGERQACIQATALSSLCLGGLVQADYRYFDFDSEDPDQNRFDLRRVRMLLKGSIQDRFDYKFEYEFEGAGARNLMDAYVDVLVLSRHWLRFGQFKEPFSLEHCTKDKNIFLLKGPWGII